MHTSHAKCVVNYQRDLVLVCNLYSNHNTERSQSVYITHTLAISLMGLTLYFGFPIISTNIALVFSSIAAANAEGSSEVTNLTPMSYFFKNTTKMISFSHICVFIYEKIDLPLN